MSFRTFIHVHLGRSRMPLLSKWSDQCVSGGKVRNRIGRRSSMAPAGCSHSSLFPCRLEDSIVFLFLFVSLAPVITRRTQGPWREAREVNSLFQLFCLKRQLKCERVAFELFFLYFSLYFFLSFLFLFSIFSFFFCYFSHSKTKDQREERQ